MSSSESSDRESSDASEIARLFYSIRCFDDFVSTIRLYIGFNFLLEDLDPLLLRGDTSAAFFFVMAGDSAIPNLHLRSASSLLSKTVYLSVKCFG